MTTAEKIASCKQDILKDVRREEDAMKRDTLNYALRMVFVDGVAFGKLYSGQFVPQEVWERAYAESLAGFQSNTKPDHPSSKVSSAQPAIFED
jgi:hypothetical protein